MGTINITFKNEYQKDITYRTIFIDTLEKLLEEDPDLFGDFRITIPIFNKTSYDKHIIHIRDGNKEQLNQCREILNKNKKTRLIKGKKRGKNLHHYQQGHS